MSLWRDIMHEQVSNNQEEYVETTLFMTSLEEPKQMYEMFLFVTWKI